MNGARGIRPSLRVLMVVLAATLLAGGVVGTAGAAAEKVELCHAPGTPDEKTISVSENAAGMHIAHGDVLGSCEDVPPQPPPPVLDEVQARGLRCGVSQGFAVGFSEFDEGTDTWSGLDVDLCRAVAAAVLGDSNDVVFVPLSSTQRFPAVREGGPDGVDVLFRTTTDTLTRDASYAHGGEGVNFGPTYFYDGAGILANAAEFEDCVAGDCGFENLNGKSVCVTANTTTQDHLADLIDDLGLNVEVLAFASYESALGAFVAGRCAAFADYQAGLIGISQGIEFDTIIFEDTFSKEPLAPVVRDGDDEWMAVVRWTVYAAFLAEELGFTQSSVPTSFGNGVTGPALGLDSAWAYNVIKEVGNYAEMYKSNLTTPYGLDRGRNASYVDGGLIYAPPIR